MPKYVEGMIVDIEHVICPDHRIRRWYPVTSDPTGYETLFGLERGFLKSSASITVVGWRKDSDKRFIMRKGCLSERFQLSLPRTEMWTSSAKSEEQLQIMAKARRERLKDIHEYEQAKNIDIKNQLPFMDTSEKDKDPLPLPY